MMLPRFLAWANRCLVFFEIEINERGTDLSRISFRCSQFIKTQHTRFTVKKFVISPAYTENLWII